MPKLLLDYVILFTRGEFMFKDLVFKSLLGKDFLDKIHIDKKKCMRNSAFKDKCSKCKDICPEKAISVLDNSVEIDELLCTGCGNCVTNCYSRALSMKSNFYTLMYLNIFNSEESTYHCLKAPSDTGVNGCFRLMDYRFLTAFNATDIAHKLTFDLSKCEDCKYKSLNENFESDLLEIFGDGEGGPSYALVEEVEVQEDGPVSRREFLDSFRRKGTSVKDNLVNEVVEQLEFLSEEEFYRDDLDRIVYALLKSVEDRELEIASTKYIYGLAIDSKCNMCRICANICPKNALEIVTRDGETSIVYDASKCNFCGLCMEKCETSAISKTLYRGFGKSTLYVSERQRCKLCRAKVAKLNDNGLCDTCFVREKNRKTKNN